MFIQNLTKYNLTKILGVRYFNKKYLFDKIYYKCIENIYVNKKVLFKGTLEPIYLIKHFSTSVFYKNIRKNGTFDNYLETADNTLLNNENEEFKEILYDEEYESFVSNTGGNLFGYSFIAVLQPWIKWGKMKKHYTSPTLLLDEACALIYSLPSMKVVFKEYVTLHEISSSKIFRSGNLDRLKFEIGASSAQAIFISIDNINRSQRSFLEEHFCMKVFDRYTIVLAIFKFYANTTESRLQIALAELPSMRRNILTEKDKLMIHQREADLKSAITKLTKHRNHLRDRRKKYISSIAVVGYTNCGKTSLIRMLTGDERMEGEDRLFATLDVTVHKGLLPCGLNVVFIDSVGFIQDIPTTLIASFNATLQDAIYADVIIHIRDISHPDIVAQTKSVNETLSCLPLPEGTPVILVNNKTDLLEEKLKKNNEIDKSNPVYKEGIYISAKTGNGVPNMLKIVQSELLKITGRKLYRMKLPTGSQKIDWLKQSFGVTSEQIAEDANYTNITVIMNEAEKAAFRKAFND